MNLKRALLTSVSGLMLALLWLASLSLITQAADSDPTVTSPPLTPLANHPNDLLPADPELVFSTYLGDGNRETGYAINVDDAGNIYVAARTTDETLGPAPALITQFINNGGVYTYGYSTSIGNSDDYHIINDLDFDGNGNIYLAGSISGGVGSDEDVFVAHLIRSGGDYMPGYFFRLGGSETDYALDQVVSDDGSVYVIGTTSSTDFPTRNALQGTYGGGFNDAFLTQIISASGIYTYGFSTYLGGSDGDSGSGIALDDEGHIYVSGSTSSVNFPTWQALHGDQPGEDVFVTQIISASGVYTYGFSTYLDSSSDETAGGIAVDSMDNIYINGTILISPFPFFNRDIFVRQLIDSGGVYTYGYSTYLGGDAEDYTFSIALDDEDNVYIAGTTYSDNFPIQDAVQETFGGALDTFVTKIISANGGLTYDFSTYLGGSDTDPNYGLAVDSAGNIYVTGATFSTDFPLANATQDTFGGGFEDAYVAVIGAAPQGLAVDLAITKVVTPAMAKPGQTITYTVVFSNQGTGKASNVVITDIAPAQLTNVSVDSSGVVITPTNIGVLTYTWQSQDLALDQRGVITLTGQIKPNATNASVFTNTAAITSGTSEMDMTNNEASASLTVLAPNLSLTKRVDDSTPWPGQRITYTLIVDNNGGGAATNSVISDTLSAGLTLAGPVTLEGTQGITGNPPLLASGLTITAGTRITLTFPVTVNTSLASGTVITNMATVTSAEITIPITGTATVTVIDGPAIFVTKSANISTVQVGQTITYSYRVTNTGTMTLTGVSADDDKLGQIPLDLTTLPPNQSTTGLLNYTVAEADLPGPLTNTVIVTGTPATGPPVTSSAEAAVTLLPLNTDPDVPQYLPVIVKGN